MSPDAGKPGSASRFDVHVHLAGVGTQGSGCWVSPRFRRRPTFLGMRFLHGISRRQMQTTVDQDWAAVLSAKVAESSVDYAVALGFDGVYDGRGQLDRERSQMIVPPQWVFTSCRRHRNLLPGPSINPLRQDALDVLDACIEQGAVLIKWLPVVQGFDPADPRATPFLRRVADAGIPLLVHAGSGEVTFATVDPDLGPVRSLVPALEMGVRVICAHSAAPVIYSRDPSELPELRRLLSRFQNLWVDNSGLANPSRFPYLPRFANDPDLIERTLHGSDYPVITHPFYYPRRLGLKQVVRIQAVGNTLEREVRLKRALGFGESTFTRASAVLANLDRWC